MFELVRKWLGGHADSRRQGQRSPARSWGPAWLRGRYDAATTTDDNRRHWAAADGLSANSANNPEVRRILRNRARHEVSNNPYAKGIILTLANDSISTGPRLQILTADAEANRRLEIEFHHWARAVSLAARLRTLEMARITDGEGFAILTSNPRLSTPIQLDFTLVEADQVTTPDLTYAKPQSVDGIVFDRHGNPTEYHVLKSHPGDRYGSLGLDYDRVPAESLIHYFRAERPGQARGIPDVTPALPLFAQLRRFTLAVIAAAETVAEIGTGVIYTDAPADEKGVDAAPYDQIELERRMFTVLPDGWKMGQMHAEQPVTTYKEFKREILNEVARCFNMPFNVAACNSSDYNYASGRLDHQVYWKSLRVAQSHLERVVLDRLLIAWLDEAVLIKGFLPTGLGPISQWPHRWFWDGVDHIDPLKEANAQGVRLTNHTTTLADEYARRGQDWETQLRQRAKELALMAELGLTPESLALTPSPDATPLEEQNAEASQAA